MAIWAIIPAAGNGRRLGALQPKQYLAVAGRALILHVLDCFFAEPRIAGIAIALAPEDREWPAVAPAEPCKPVVTVPGGRDRSDSVLSALNALAGKLGQDDWVMVHDAARPCLRTEDVAHLIDVLINDSVGGVLAAPVVDTLKRVDSGGHITATVPRKGLWRALTPQMFRYGLLQSALLESRSARVIVTDEAMAVERAGYVPRLVAGSGDNIKVTRAEDLALAEAILLYRHGSFTK